MEYLQLEQQWKKQKWMNAKQKNISLSNWRHDTIMEMKTIKGSVEDVLFELYAMKDFYISIYDMQDEEVQKEICIALEAIDHELGKLEGK